MEKLFNHFLLQFLGLQSESDVSDILKLCIGFDIEENIFFFFFFFFFFLFFFYKIMTFSNLEIIQVLTST